MANPAWSDFEGAEGKAYSVDTEAGQLEFVLEAATELPSSGRTEGAFSLEFRGPFDPVLPQATYRFRNGNESADIFIVAIGREDKGTLYEAVFY
jgi:hypothetical protein